MSYERISLYGRSSPHPVPEMDRNPGNPKIFFLQHRDENINEVKIVRHKSHDLFQRGPVHEPVRNITCFTPPPVCNKTGKGNTARYQKSPGAVVCVFSPAINNFSPRGLIQKG